MTPLYSVIMPAYNRAPFLPRALRSVAEQDGIDRQGIEILLVDDGSTDDTRSVVQSLGIGPAVLKYIRIEHCGQPGTTRNVALDRAQGKHIAYCDSDDFWFPHHLATAQKEFERYPEAMMVSTYWGLARYVLKPDGTIENHYVVPPHPVTAVNTNCRVHFRGCIDGANAFRFNTARWDEDGDFFRRIEANFVTKKVMVVTNVCGYIAGGNNLTYQFDQNVKSKYF